MKNGYFQIPDGLTEIRHELPIVDVIYILQAVEAYLSN
ncbi:MAG: hypothetical protein JWL84_4663 [Rhodospirillales bacterium]|nr:hypothetical protein [Rhodospirillales bacterium]